MAYVDLISGSYHEDGCEWLTKRPPGHILPVSDGMVENGFYPKGTCCYEPSAGDSVNEFIDL